MTPHPSPHIAAIIAITGTLLFAAAMWWAVRG
jgi:hypothetical protein